MAQGEKTVNIPSPSGEFVATFHIVLKDERFTFTCEGDCTNWHILFVGYDDPMTVVGGIGEVSRQGFRVTPNPDQRVVTVTF
jgi:hypothetical protein